MEMLSRLKMQFQGTMEILHILFAALRSHLARLPSSPVKIVIEAVLALESILLRYSVTNPQV